jgi:hypothetical protein
MKIKLANISYCGIEFNNNKWHSHIQNCNICKNKYEELKCEEIIKSKEWNKKCECGCGEKTKYKNNYICGHSIKNKKQTKEHKEKRFNSWFLNGNTEKSIERMKNNNPCKSKNSIDRMKNNNPAKNDNVKKKLSENNAMNNKENITKIHNTKIKNYGITYGKVLFELSKKTMVNKYGEDNPSKIKSILERRIETYCNRLANGDYKLKNNWVCGEYIRKNGENEWYDSSFELKKMIEYDEIDIKWTKKHKIRIPYINENNLNTFYVPDFIIELDGQYCLVETKGYLKSNDILKAQAGKEYCQKNNMNYLYYLGSPDNLNMELSFFK